MAVYEWSCLSGLSVDEFQDLPIQFGQLRIVSLKTGQQTSGERKPQIVSFILIFIVVMQRFNVDNNIRSEIQIIITEKTITGKSWGF